MEFHKAMGQPIGMTPSVPSDERVRLRLRLVAEEFFELLAATDDVPFESTLSRRLDHAHSLVIEYIAHAQMRVDIVEAADALADLAYVIEGTALEFGISSEPIAKEVHRSNMTKSGMREDGKIAKGPNYSPPNIAGCLRDQGWNPDKWQVGIESEED
jgi:predicted HAD superfamily Cof-like phosphohydrolase